MAGLRFPLSTLHVWPRGCPRMTRGRNGAATPFTWGSFIPYSMPVYPGAFEPSPILPILFRFYFHMRNIPKRYYPESNSYKSSAACKALFPQISYLILALLYVLPKYSISRLISFKYFFSFSFAIFISIGLE